MAGVVQKMQALNDALGEYHLVRPNTWMNDRGSYLIYHKKTGRLSVNDTVVMLEADGSATFRGSIIFRFKRSYGDIWTLTKRRAKRKEPKPKKK